MTRAAVFALVAGFAFPALADPAFEQHFSPSENLEQIDVALIDTAGETVDFAAYVLTDVAVIEALDRATLRGVFRDSGDTDRGRPGEMHLKAYCLDGATFRFGAANFSASGLKRQANDLNIRRGPDACGGFRALFEGLWANG